MAKAYSTGRKFDYFNSWPITEKTFSSILTDCIEIAKEFGNTEKLESNIKLVLEKEKEVILSKPEYFKICLANYMLNSVISLLWNHIFNNVRITEGERNAENKANDALKRFLKKYS